MQKEINLASSNKIKIVPLMFDNLNDSQLQGIALLLSGLLRINIYNDPNIRKEWKGQLSEQIIKSIQFNLNEKKVIKNVSILRSKKPL